MHFSSGPNRIDSTSNFGSYAGPKPPPGSLDESRWEQKERERREKERLAAEDIAKKVDVARIVEVKQRQGEDRHDSLKVTHRSAAESAAELKIVAMDRARNDFQNPDGDRVAYLAADIAAQRATGYLASMENIAAAKREEKIQSQKTGNSLNQSMGEPFRKHQFYRDSLQLALAA